MKNSLIPSVGFTKWKKKPLLWIQSLAGQKFVQVPMSNNVTWTLTHPRTTAPHVDISATTEQYRARVSVYECSLNV